MKIVTNFLGRGDRALPDNAATATGFTVKVLDETGYYVKGIYLKAAKQE